MLKWVWIAVVIIVADQLSKWGAEATLTLGEPIAIFPHLNFTLAYNEGAAFSILEGQRWFFVSLGVVVSIFILIWMSRLSSKETGTAIGLSLILGGAIGNLIDRFLHGKVVDFIDFYFSEGGYHFATFNIADIAITLGATLLVIISLFFAEDEEKVTS